ncbi:MAG: glycosyltransferase family 2 protein [Eubacterium sp.]
MMNELISVVIPVYNAEKYIKRCLNSIMNQTYDNLQIVVVNDGSTDDTKKILEEYSNNDNRIVVVIKVCRCFSGKK